MFVSRHIILGILFSAFLYLIFPNIGLLGISIIFLSSVLIDVDHYLYYVYDKKDWSLKNAYKWFVEKIKVFRRLSKEEKKTIKYPILLFHGIEFFLILYIFYIINEFFLFVIIGCAFHLLFDLLEIIYLKAPLYIKLSTIYVYFKNKYKKEI